MESTGIKITLMGKEVEFKPIQYEGHKSWFPEMQYYHMRGNSYYFRNKQGGVLIMDVKEDLHNHIKYGQVMDLEVTEDLPHSELHLGASGLPVSYTKKGWQ